MRSFGNLPFRRRIVAMVALVAALVALAAASAYAYFTATVASGGNGGAVSASLPPGSTPAVSLSGGSVTVTWAQSTVGGQRLGVYAGGGYTVKRYPASGGSGVTPGASCSTTIGGASEKLSCTESNVPPGSWKYTVTPVLNSWVGAESAHSAAVTIIGPPAGVAVQSGSPQSATVKTSFAGALVALVTDAGGNPVPGVIVTFAAPSSGASGTFENGTATTTATTASNGQATASAFTANTNAGGYTVSASVSGVSATASFSLTNNPGVASKLAFTPATPGPGIAGESIPNVAVSVEDSFGNVVSSQGSGSVSISIKAGSAQASFTSGTTTASVSKGVASFANLVVDTSGSYTFTATPSSIGGVSAPVDSSSFTVSSAAASKLAFTTEPSGAVTPKNSVFPTQPVVTVEDAFGNKVSTDSFSVMLTLKNNLEKASLNCTANPVTASGGVASFAGCKINKDGTFSLHAADGTLTAADSTNIIVTN